ncbi:MAG: Crp/Fnr family transcriptional regulator [Gammaproteobacteria bacterium]
MASVEERLVGLFRTLGAGDQATLLAFAEFLSSRSIGLGSTAPAPGDTDTAVQERTLPEPEPIPRPESESVVAAVKRLSRTYHMIEKRHMLNETSALVAQHVMQGRDAVEVIDELELVFQRRYEALKSDD